MNFQIHLKSALAKIFLIIFSVSRIIYFSKGIWNEYYGFYSMSPEVGVIDQLLLAFATVVGCILSFLCVMDYIKSATRKRKIEAIIVMLGFIIFFIVWVIDFFQRNSIRLLFVGNFTPLTLIFFGILFAGENSQFIESVSFFSGYIAILFLVLAAFFNIQFYIMHGAVGVRYGYSNALIYFEYGFYALLLYVCGYKEFRFKKKRKMIFGLIVLTMILAIMSVSRGWIIQALALLIYFYLGVEANENSQKSKRARRIVVTLVILGGIAVGIIQFAPQIVETLGGRINQDTRSLQLIEFISQMNVRKALLGQGFNATYLESAHGVYSYIDNQILMMIFRYGCVPTFLYLLYVIKASINFFRYKDGYGFFSIMWLLALNGLAIYLGFGIDIQNFCMMLIISRSVNAK